MAIVHRRRASARAFTRLVTEPSPQFALPQPQDTPGRSPSSRKGSKRLPGLTPRHATIRIGRNPSKSSAGLFEPEQPQERDFGSKALLLSRKFNVEFYEVKTMLEELQKIIDRHGDEGVSLEQFHEFLCKVFDVPMVEDRVVQNAYSASQFAKEPEEPGGAIVIEKFLDWYKINMFSEVSRIRAGADAHNSAELVRALARKYGVYETDVDKAKMAFDKYDLDKSGDIDYSEFTAMMKDMIGAGARDATQLSEARLKIFWNEIDSDCSGSIDFSEFTCFFVKYFLSGSGFGGIAEAFYASHRPDVQFQALSRRNPQDADVEASPHNGVGVDRSKPLPRLSRIQRTRTIH